MIAMRGSKKPNPKTTVNQLALHELEAAEQKSASVTPPISARVQEAMRSGRYQIDPSTVAVIGSGMGGVVEACQIVLDSGEGRWAARKKKSMTEIDRHLRVMEHTNVVSLLGWDKEYMYTSLAELGSLHSIDVPRRLAQAATASEQAKWLTFILQVIDDKAQGLNHIHSKRVVHRDVKGQNSLVNKHGRVLVSDFGLSHTARDEEQKSYTPGEYVAGSKIVDLQGVYGVLIYLLDGFEVASAQLGELKRLKDDLEGVFLSGEALKQAPIQTCQQLLDRLQQIKDTGLFRQVVLKTKSIGHGQRTVTGIKYKPPRRSLSVPLRRQPVSSAAEVAQTLIIRRSRRQKRGAKNKRLSRSLPPVVQNEEQDTASSAQLILGGGSLFKVVASIRNDVLHRNVRKDRGDRRRRKHKRQPGSLAPIRSSRRRGKKRKSEGGDENPRRPKSLR
ncbi:MAG: protein kinase [Coxiellaceae bacterium]|nr:protein kinase [Coxiellaceae bacterium]